MKIPAVLTAVVMLLFPHIVFAQTIHSASAAASEFYAAWISNEPYESPPQDRADSLAPLQRLSTPKFAAMLEDWSEAGGYDPVSSLDDGANQAVVGECQGGGMVAACEVRLSADVDVGRVEWQDTVYLLNLSGRWLVFDIGYGDKFGDKGGYAYMSRLVASDIRTSQGMELRTPDE